MRVAFVGKGGSGKTTLSALFSRHLARSGAPVVAIDGDINQHLAEALAPVDGGSFSAPPLSSRLAGIKDYLRGANPRIASAEAMVKTTPARPGFATAADARRRPGAPRHVEPSAVCR